MHTALSRNRIVELLEGARGKRIVVVGDAMLDVYLAGDVERISPEAPVPVVRVRERRHALGGAANVAQNVVAIGARCDLICAVGADGGGETLSHLLRDAGIEGEPLIAAGRPTTLKTRIVARGQQLVRVDEEDDRDLASIDAERLADRVRTGILGADAVILEDYNKGVLMLPVIEAAMQLAGERGLPVVVDPKFRNFFSYRGATIFKPNRRELEAALGAALDLDHPETLPATLERLGVEQILLTLGEQGMVLFSRDGEVARVPAMAREVYDVVGAGDTVSAYLAAVMAAGGSPAEAAIIANIAAGIEVGKRGAATVTPAELLAHMEHAAS